MKRIKKAAPRAPGRKPLYPELGVSGLKRYSGFVFEEFLHNLRGQRGMEVYKEIRDNSAKVGAALGAAKMTAANVTWWVEPNKDDPQGAERAAFVESCRRDMSSGWRNVVGEAFSMLPFGFAPLEIVYKRRMGTTTDPRGRSHFTDGMIGWRKLPLRAQETVFQWDFDDQGGIQGLYQLAPPRFQRIYIPIEKLLLFRTETERNNPEGRSVLRNAYLAYYVAKRLTEITVIGVERDLNGIPVMWIPPEVLKGETPEQLAARDQYYQIVKNLRQDEQAGLVLPLVYDDGGRKLYDLTLLTTTGRRQFDLVAILQHFEGAIVASMLHDLLMGGQANTIQYRGASMPDMFAASIGGWLDVIADVFNSHAIPRLYRVNGWDTAACAKLRHGEPSAPDLAKLADFISKIAPVGFMAPDQALLQHLRRVAGLPDAEDPKPLAPPPEGAPSDQAPDDTDAAPGVVEQVRKKPHSYSSTQVELPPRLAQAVRMLADRIPDKHLAGDGRETRPHSTVKYGLLTSNAEAVRGALAGQGPVTLTLGKTSLFPPSESSNNASVLKIDVESTDLQALNGHLEGALDHVRTHAYEPHVTVAYLKPEAAAQYAGDASIEGQRATIDSVTFIGKDGQETTIPLAAKASVAVAGRGL